METLFWNQFKTKMNKKYTLHTQILKNEQKLLNLH
jgi:hypothetical protein